MSKKTPALNEKALAPCPFCGNTNIRIMPNRIGDYYAICYSDDPSEYACGASTSDRNCETPEGARQRWNRRPAQAQPEQAPAPVETSAPADVGEVVTDFRRYADDGYPFEGLCSSDLTAAADLLAAQSATIAQLREEVERLNAALSDADCAAVSNSDLADFHMERADKAEQFVYFYVDPGDVRPEHQADVDRIQAEQAALPPESAKETPPKGKTAGVDFPCALHRGPAGICHSGNCKCF